MRQDRVRWRAGPAPEHLSSLPASRDHAQIQAKEKVALWALQDCSPSGDSPLEAQNHRAQGHTLTFSSSSRCFSKASVSVKPTHSASSSGITKSYSGRQRGGSGKGQAGVADGHQGMGRWASGPHLVFIVNGSPPGGIIGVQLGVLAGESKQHPSFQIHPKLGAQVLLGSLEGRWVC